jgi:hypothetical protein
LKMGWPPERLKMLQVLTWNDSLQLVSCVWALVYMDTCASEELFVCMLPSWLLSFSVFFLGGGVGICIVLNKKCWHSAQITPMKRMWAPSFWRGNVVECGSVP